MNPYSMSDGLPELHAVINDDLNCNDLLKVNMSPPVLETNSDVTTQLCTEIYTNSKENIGRRCLSD